LAGFHCTEENKKGRIAIYLTLLLSDEGSITSSVGEFK
jgi:hypothetical protein